MISVDEALGHLFALARPLGSENVAIRHAAGRVLAEPVSAGRDQPPFSASAMDGYAIAGPAKPGTSFTVIGQAAAGHAFNGKIETGQAVRIFTGAPLPQGATGIVIQEDVLRDGDRITLGDQLDRADHIRPAGGDFTTGTVFPAPKRLSPQDLTLLATMNLAYLPVIRRPEVAILATGDELVLPGETPRPDQIIAANGIGLTALLEAEGALVRLLPVAKDSEASLIAALEMAAGADLIVTIGGASVGDHDLVGPVAESMGLDRSFYKIAMRPGKPLMAGRLGGSAMVGLPGNPVSSMVCGHIFLRPLIRAFLDLGQAPLARDTACLAAPLGPNGPREHYMRGYRTPEGVTADARQDSSLTSVLAAADLLIIRPIRDPAREIGDKVEILSI